MSQMEVLRPLRFPQDQADFLNQLRALYPSISEMTLLERLIDVKNAGWSCIGAFIKQADSGEGLEKMIGIGGYWIQNRFCYGTYLYIDHFIVSDSERGQGLGKRMWLELERIAREHGCVRIVLDTFVTNSVAQRFWMDQGCDIVGFHFGKNLIKSEG